MVIKTTTLFGNRVCDNQIPKTFGTPIIKLKGNGMHFGISEEQLSTHILVLGATGTGKTNAIKHMIRQIKSQMKQNDVMLVFDSKFDFVSFHNGDDYIISNNKTGNGSKAAWNIYMDVVADGWDKDSISLNADEISSVIFSEQIDSSNQPFFPQAARDIFSALIKAMTFLGISDTDYRVKYLNNAALAKYLRTTSAQQIIEFLGSFPELKGVLKYVGNGTSEQALGVFAELQAATGKMFVKCFGEDGRFSVRKAVKQKGARTLFVEYDPSCGLSIQPMYRIIVDLFLKEALSPAKAHGHVYVICDELKMLPHLNHFEDALNFGRSLGISVIAGIQSMEQLYEVYGEYGGRNIASGFQNTFCFRTNNAASREYIQSIHGRNCTSMQFLSASNKAEEETREGYSVEDWDIVSLNKGEAVIGLSGEKPFKFYIERYMGN